MPFLSATASKKVNSSGGGGGYLTASKLGDGESTRIAILSEEPLEFFCQWGEDPSGNKKPFRFVSEPTPSDIQAEMGEFEPRLNFEGTAVEKPKFAVCCFVFEYQSESVKVLEIGQKGLLKELDALSQSEDYANLHEWDFTISREGMKLNTVYRIVPGPRKKGMQEKIDAAWSEAQKQGYDLNQLLIGGNPFGESNA